LTQSACGVAKFLATADQERYAANTTDNLKLLVLGLSLSVEGDEHLATQGVDASSM
jgi:hypothetical protein